MHGVNTVVCFTLGTGLGWEAGTVAIWPESTGEEYFLTTTF